MRSILLVLAISAPALAQEQEVQRALIQRDQQSADFVLRLKQAQEGVQPAPGDNRHLNERQRLENLSSQQLLEVKKNAPQELRPYERQKSADDRVLLFPPPVVRTQPPENARPRPAPIGPAY